MLREKGSTIRKVVYSVDINLCPFRRQFKRHTLDTPLSMVD